MKILVVDDEYVALQLMTNLYRSYGECTPANNSLTALQTFTDALNQGEPFDLVSIDIEMPGMKGVDLMMELANIELKHNILPSKKIIVSAEATRDNVLNSKRAGVDAFIVKPCNKATLHAKLIEAGAISNPEGGEGDKEFSNSSKPKILIADSNADTRQDLARIITGIIDCDMVMVAGGGEAIKMFRQIKPHLVISDVALPQVSGFDFIKMLRAEPNNSNIPVIIFSEKADKDTVFKLSKLSIAGYLSKNISIEVLKPKVYALITNIFKSKNIQTKDANASDAKFKIMLADSDTAFTQSFVKYFSKSFEITVVTSFDELIAKFSEINVSIVLLDEKLTSLTTEGVSQKLAATKPANKFSLYYLSNTNLSARSSSSFISGNINKANFNNFVKDFAKIVFREDEVYSRLIRINKKTMRGKLEELLMRHILLKTGSAVNYLGEENAESISVEFLISIDLVEEASGTSVTIGIGSDQPAMVKLCNLLGSEEQMLSTKALAPVIKGVELIANEFLPIFESLKIKLRMRPYKVSTKKSFRLIRQWNHLLPFRLSEHYFIFGMMVSKIIND